MGFGFCKTPVPNTTYVNNFYYPLPEPEQQPPSTPKKKKTKIKHYIYTPQGISPVNINYLPTPASLPSPQLPQAMVCYPTATPCVQPQPVTPNINIYSAPCTPAVQPVTSTWPTPHTRSPWATDANQLFQPPVSPSSSDSSASTVVDNSTHYPWPAQTQAAAKATPGNTVNIYQTPAPPEAANLPAQYTQPANGTPWPSQPAGNAPQNTVNIVQTPAASQKSVLPQAFPVTYTPAATPGRYISRSVPQTPANHDCSSPCQCGGYTWNPAAFTPVIPPLTPGFTIGSERKLHRNLETVDWDIRKPLSLLCFGTRRDGTQREFKRTEDAIPSRFRVLEMRLNPGPRFGYKWHRGQTQGDLIHQFTMGYPGVLHPWGAPTVEAAYGPITVERALVGLQLWLMKPLTTEEIQYITTQGFYPEVVIAASNRSCFAGPLWGQTDHGVLRRIDLFCGNTRVRGFRVDEENASRQSLVVTVYFELVDDTEQ